MCSPNFRWYSSIRRRRCPDSSFRILSNTVADAGKSWRSPSEKSAYTRSSSSSREMAKARISRSDNSLKFFMAQLDYQCAGLVPKPEDLTAEGPEDGRWGSGVLFSWITSGLATIHQRCLWAAG